MSEERITVAFSDALEIDNKGARAYLADRILDEGATIEEVQDDLVTIPYWIFKRPYENCVRKKRRWVFAFLAQVVTALGCFVLGLLGAWKLAQAGAQGLEALATLPPAFWLFVRVGANEPLQMAAEIERLARRDLVFIQERIRRERGL